MSDLEGVVVEPPLLPFEPLLPLLPLVPLEPFAPLVVLVLVPVLLFEESSLEEPVLLSFAGVFALMLV